MDPLFIVASVLFIFGLILMFKTAWLYKINKYCNKVIFTDAEFFSSPRASGILFIVVGIAIIIIGFYVKDMVKLIAL